MAGKRSLAIAAIAVALAAVALAAAALIDGRDVFTGTRTKNIDTYAMQFSEMNQTDTHTLTLEAGAELAVTYVIEKGQFDLSIGIAGHPNAYTGTDLTGSAAFRVVAEEPGAYTVTVAATHAAGSLSVIACQPA